MGDRYFPFSQDFNSDAEGWEFTDTFGDRALRTWAEILSILDRQKNHWKLVEGWDSVIGRKVRQSPGTVRKEVLWMISKRWLEVIRWSANGSPDLGQWLASGWPVVGQLSAGVWPEVLRAPKWGKYHKTRSGDRPPPNLTEPNLTPIVPNGDDVFERFWKEYPKKIGKGAAEKSWKKIQPGKELADKIIAAVGHQITWPQWIKEDGQYIPNPSTWLNQKRWQDEITGELNLPNPAPKIQSVKDGVVYFKDGGQMRKEDYEREYNTHI